MATTYTIKWGDTLSQIAETYKNVIGPTLSNKARVDRLCALNRIPNPDLIYAGAVIYLDSNRPKSVAAPNAPTIDLFGHQNGTDRTIFATWDWDKKHVDNYRTIWYYATGDGVWFVGNDSTTTFKQSIYTPPDNATKIKFKVKPTSTKDKKVTSGTGKNKKTTQTYWWTATWSTEREYSMTMVPPKKPPTPSVEIEKFKLTARLDNLDVEDLNCVDIHFQVYVDDTTFFKSAYIKVEKGTAIYVVTDLAPGKRYRVRARCRNQYEEPGDFSDFSDNYETIPAAPSGWVRYRALTSTSVYLDWENVSGVTKYELQYTQTSDGTKYETAYFDSNPSEVKSITLENVGHAEITGMESGKTYYFRVRAINDQGESAWSSIVNISLGVKPAAPTTWSSTTTAKVGEPLYLYWVHNSKDGSSQTKAELYLKIDGAESTITIDNTTDEETKDKTSVYDKIDTSKYNEGTTIEWRVRTEGITGLADGDWSPWSETRTITVYAVPTLIMDVLDYTKVSNIIIRSFPFYVTATAEPKTQKPIGYHLSITANESYGMDGDVVDDIGNEKIVLKGDTLYSEYFDISGDLIVAISAEDIDIENNQTYIVTCSVSMDSGLSAAESRTIKVAWEGDADMFAPNAQIGIDSNTLSAIINPYCETSEGTLTEGVTLAVYRREFDGGFTEIASGMENAYGSYVTDPHPALDYARYRIIAKSTATGNVKFYDIPAIPIGEPSVIIQWSERWSKFDYSDDETNALAEQPWSGSMLKLPYNVDVSDNVSPDVSLVEYVGRSHPVSYYGTQRGNTATWNVEIEKDDTETLYNLRRLAIYMGDVYVREPSGSGYWANIKVSFSQKHCELTIPVTMSITRVEGGV